MADMTIKEVASKLGITRQMVLHYIKHGVLKRDGGMLFLKASSFGRRFIIREESLRDFMIESYKNSMYYKYFED